MLDYRNKEFIKQVGNGELYRVVNYSGFEYYTIEENGVEVCSTNTSPERMIEHYKKRKEINQQLSKKGEKMDIIKEDDILKKYNEILKRNNRMTIEEIIDENIKSQVARMQAELELGLRINVDIALLIIRLLKLKELINK